MINAEWRNYEIAVQKFLDALEPNAKVVHDVKLPDKHTGKPRQRDIFIEATICGNIPVKILVSCKRYKRKLNESDIDHFYGELISSGAHKGVIYSFLGFNQSAIEKSKVLGISCCRLYSNQPPEIPDFLYFPNVYCCSSTIGIDILDYLDSKWGFEKWKDVFEYKIVCGLEHHPLIEVLSEYISEYESKSVEEVKMGKSIFPLPVSFAIEITNTDEEINAFKLFVRFGWKYYKGKVSGCFIDGSYSFSDNGFVGSQSTPVIDTKSTTPGEAWILLENRPEKPEGNCLIAILFEANIIETLKTIEMNSITFAKSL